MTQLDGAKWVIVCGEALATMRAMEDNSVDLIATDPPYFKVKSEPWDRQWDKPAGFLAWIGELCEQWQRILKPNGSLYCFASPKMAARVECKIAERFNIVNRITWAKPAFSTKAEMNPKVWQRGYFPTSEAIIFAEHYGADNMAKGEVGYVAKYDELRGFVFEPLRAYLSSERSRAGLTTRQVAEAFQCKTGSRTVTGMAGHWFEYVQWALPTAENYRWLRELFNAKGGEYLRREYEDLRHEYEELRRPFNVTAEDQYTDVWSFKTVGHYKGKHPCEKPLALMRQIVSASSREDAVVLDCFAGSGTTGVAAVGLDRRFIGIELQAKWCECARQRICEAEA